MQVLIVVHQDSINQGSITLELVISFAQYYIPSVENDRHRGAPQDSYPRAEAVIRTAKTNLNSSRD